MIEFLNNKNNVVLLLESLKFLIGLLTGGLLGGYFGYRWKMVENRSERKRVFKVMVSRMAEKIASGNPWNAAATHESMSPVLRDACLNVMPDYSRWTRKKVDAAWRDFAAIPYDDLTPSGEGDTNEERVKMMRRGLDKMEARLRSLEKLI